jgi:decaprenylphospho-beta-D-ribofuranose 2-oxidase
MTSGTRALTGWGRTAPTVATVVDGGDVDAIARAVKGADGRGVIARGLGRSYGDAAQNAGGLVVDMTRLDRIHDLDVDAATVTVDAGVSLDTLLRRAVGEGLWVPVLPGTRQVTVGGAIAADIHGGNHHTRGSFCNHVTSIDLLTAAGDVRTLTPDGPSSDLFWATAGGMGQTGIVLRATIRLERVETAYFVADVERAADFDELLERVTANDESYTYSKTWFDSVSTGPSMGRGFVLRGSSAKVDDLPPSLRKEPLRFDAPQLGTVPDVFPNGMLNRFTARAFNELVYRANRPRQGVVMNLTTFYHVLDVANEWNRVYGRRGFLQYQFVVPFGKEAILRQSMDLISSSGHLSCLNVLKRFGEGNRGHISFPMAGWTLAVDMPVRPGLGRLCDQLDELVVEAGGRIYLAKDSRASAATIARMYPRLPEWQSVVAEVDPESRFRSDLSRRLHL